MPAGRPAKYKSAEKLQQKIDEYFKNPPTISKKVGDEVMEVPCLTITGLVLFLGFSDRRSFYDLEKKEEFSHTIKRARTFIEHEYEKQLQSGNTTGAIFALKNFGWKDKIEQEHSGRLDGSQQVTWNIQPVKALAEIERFDNQREDS